MCNENVFPLNVKFIYFVKPGQEIKTIYNGQRSSALTLYTIYTFSEARGDSSHALLNWLLRTKEGHFVVNILATNTVSQSKSGLPFSHFTLI